MSSLMTNAGAMTALQTLKATNKALDVTQGRISTGFRVAEASHNAAYWSIATTMRSDNKSMSTVQDALGLGAAQVDIAYTAMDAVKGTLDEIKSKLVAASQPNIDKAKIQEEIKQLQNDLQTYAKSATFSGGNWLDVGQTGNQQVVASFIRTDQGVSLGTIDINTANIALFTGNSSGLLQGAANLGAGAGGDEAPDVSGLTEATETAADGSATVATIAGAGDLDWAEGNTFSFDVSFGGDTHTITGTYDGTDWTWEGEPAGVTVALTGSDLVVTAADLTVGDGTDMVVDNFVSGAGGDDSAGTPIAGVSDIADATGTIATADPTVATAAGFADIEWEDGDTVTFTVTVPGENSDDPYEITGTYSEEDGWTFEGAPAELTIEVNGDGELVVTADAGFGTDAGTMTVGGFEGTRAGESSGTTVTNFDITNMTTEQIGALINHVDGVLTRVTTAASDLGAIKSRISSQSDFVGKLMDAVNRGIGQLVDADMTEESSRLQALQVQQQLGIQALSIANSNSQTILALFR